MSELQEWLVTLRPDSGLPNQAESLQMLLTMPDVQIVQLWASSVRSFAVISATPGTVAQLARTHAETLVIAPNTKLSMF